MTSSHNVYEEVVHNFPVLLLLMFMVAGIYFMKDLLLFVFTKILLSIRSKMALSFLFCIVSSVLSAFLDALTVTAVLITVGVGFYSVYHKFASGKKESHGGAHDHSQDHEIPILFLTNGVLSMISDNVFVATVYIGEVKEALDTGSITHEHFEELAIAINTGTNLPSVATPNGQAAFLFLLNSALAPLIRLSYGRMVLMAWY